MSSSSAARPRRPRWRFSPPDNFQRLTKKPVPERSRRLLFLIVDNATMLHEMKGMVQSSTELGTVISQRRRLTEIAASSAKDDCVATLLLTNHALHLHARDDHAFFFALSRGRTIDPWVGMARASRLSLRAGGRRRPAPAAEIWNPEYAVSLLFLSRGVSALECGSG